MTHNEVRDELGYDPIPGGNDAMIITAQGPVLVADAAAMSDRAANPPEPPAPVIAPHPDDGGPPGKPGQARQGQPGKPSNGGAPDKKPGNSRQVTEKPDNSGQGQARGRQASKKISEGVEDLFRGALKKTENRSTPGFAGADGPSLSQTMAGYLTHPVGVERCDECLMFRPPSSCSLVQGEIIPEGHCRHFDWGKAAKEGRAGTAADPFWAWRAAALAELDEPGD